MSLKFPNNKKKNADSIDIFSPAASGLMKKRSKQRGCVDDEDDYSEINIISFKKSFYKLKRNYRPSDRE